MTPGPLTGMLAHFLRLFASTACFSRSGGITAMCGLIRIDGKAFRWMGIDTDNTKETVQQTSVVIYATRTIYTFEANGVELTVVFATPSILEERDYMMLPFSYIDYSVRSIDGKKHDIQVYFDITGEITSGDYNKIIDWHVNSLDGYDLLDMGVQKPEYLSNRDDRISWGRLYVASLHEDALLSRVGSSAILRIAFVNNTAIPENEFNYRAVSDNWPVLTFIYDLGLIGEEVYHIFLSLTL